MDADDACWCTVRVVIEHARSPGAGNFYSSRSSSSSFRSQRDRYRLCFVTGKPSKVLCHPAYLSRNAIDCIAVILLFDLSTLESLHVNTDRCQQHPAYTPYTAAASVGKTQSDYCYFLFLFILSFLEFRMDKMRTVVDSLSSFFLQTVCDLTQCGKVLK